MQFKQLRDFFVFTRKERNGLLILIFILFLAICLDFSIPFLLPDKKYDVSKWKEETEKFYSADSNSIRKNLILEEPRKEVVAEKITMTNFDPNRVEQALLLKLGVPAGIAANWVKYLQKGGRFRKKEEVMKLYGMTSGLYQHLEKFLVLTESPGQPKIFAVSAKAATVKTKAQWRKDTVLQNRFPEKKPFRLVALNDADSVQLEALPGIGPVLASRIIKYRRLLGGFYEVAQLREIYGMTEELWLKCSPFLLADSTGMKKLEINFLSVTELGRHPYIGFSHAKKIVRQRDAGGKFTSKEALAGCLSADSLHHLLPYLSLGVR